VRSGRTNSPLGRSNSGGSSDGEELELHFEQYKVLIERKIGAGDGCIVVKEKKGVDKGLPEK
jgi:hypothetical protein